MLVVLRLCLKCAGYVNVCSTSIHAGAFWVIETNYDYALMYGCNDRRDDGACDVNAEFAYVISRRRSLPVQLVRRVDYIVRRRLCIDASRLQFTNHSRTYLVISFSQYCFSITCNPV